MFLLALGAVMSGVFSQTPIRSTPATLSNNVKTKTLGKEVNINPIETITNDNSSESMLKSRQDSNTTPLPE